MQRPSNTLRHKQKSKIKHKLRWFSHANRWLTRIGLFVVLTSNRELKQATFWSTRTAAGSKLRRSRWRMMASAVLV